MSDMHAQKEWSCKVKAFLAPNILSPFGGRGRWVVLSKQNYRAAAHVSDSSKLFLTEVPIVRHCFQGQLV